MAKFDHKVIEKKWQKKWLKDGLYTPDIKSKKPHYNLYMFPYPSGEGLHAGHAFSSTGSDVHGRFTRMSTGKDVFQPIGYDSFGIHSENYAIKIKEHPAKMLERTTKNYEKQMKKLGHGYDWTRTVTTSNVNYYKWTQWLFVEMFKAGLAYRQEAQVNWCPSCKTVLADEQVINEECERCQTKVETKKLEQWFFRITDYADRLLNNLEKIDWSQRVITAQRNWIGKKKGINITYKVKDSKDTILVWTSRPDTNYGATFVVLAPEHTLADDLATKENKTKVSSYINKALKKSKEERMGEGREKTGVFTGRYAINELTGKEMPIWVTDFVLADVGTGAVVGVPGHDKRDFEFATKYDIEVVRVVVGPDGDETDITKVDQVQEDMGIMTNSDFLNGLEIQEAIETMMDHLVKKGDGKKTTSYHLRDWLISRQRYWGPPIPMVYCETCAKEGKSYFTNKKPLRKDQSDWNHEGWYPADTLPIELPIIKNYKPEGKGRGPLEDHKDFYETTCPSCKGKAKRETDVSDTFLDSAWYFLRYPSVDADNSSKKPFDTVRTKNWLPVDLYFGGAEHSVLHLMYSRFTTMVLNDLKFIDFDEPFPRFFAHGLMIKDGAKMSKSRGNVVSPDKYMEKFGADAFRMYLLFMGPMDGTPDFRDTGIEGMRRFLDRVWGALSIRREGESSDGVMHKTIKKVSEDIEHFRYNTAISSIMEYLNHLNTKEFEVTKNNIETLILLIAPFAPHMAEEAWMNTFGKTNSVHKATWPKYDKKKIKTDKVTIIVQVNGKLRGQFEVDHTITNDKEVIISMASKDKRAAKYLKDKKIKDTIFVPGKLVNFVVS